MTDRVSLTLTGRFPERFIQKALTRGARFASIRREGSRTLRLTASAADARIIEALAAELGLAVRESGRAGWPEWLKRLWARRTLAAGLLLCAALLWAFAGRVWRVEVTPLADPLPPEAEARLVRWLEDQGVKPLMRRSDVEPSLLSARILAEFEELAYAGVRLRGAHLSVEYSPEDAAPPVYRPEDAGGLYAARDAVVLSVEPLAGKACVKPGDAVRAGQLLVRGEERVGPEETRSVRALGRVTGRVWFEARREAPLTETARLRTGRVRTASALRLFSWRLPLMEAADFACQDEATEYLPVVGLYLPMAIERRTLREAAERLQPVDRGETKARLEAEALAAARKKLPPEATERLSWTETQEAEGRLIVRAVIEAEMDIAIQN